MGLVEGLGNTLFNLLGDISGLYRDNGSYYLGCLGFRLVAYWGIYWGCIGITQQGRLKLLQHYNGVYIGAIVGN